MSKAKTAVTIASAGAMAMALGTVKHWEGLAPTVKPDRLANGLPTGGYGETVGVKLGETHSEAFWSDRLAVRLREDYDAGIGKCITRQDLPDSARAMAISTSYNAGVGAVCSSPMVRKWNAGDFRGGCEAIRHWRVASHPQGPGGPAVVQRGLVNRRNDEANKCLAGLDKRLSHFSSSNDEGKWDNGVAAAPVPVPMPAPSPPVVKAEAPPHRLRALLARLNCWIFVCEVQK